MRLSLFALAILALSILYPLAAKAQCVPSPAFTLPGCDASGCTSELYLFSYFSPLFTYICDDENQFLTVDLSVDVSAYSVMTGIGKEYLTTYINENYKQIIKFYILDQWGDLASAGEGSFKNQILSSFTIYGSQTYAFTFDHSMVHSFKVRVNNMPPCSYNYGEKILKANDANSSMYQCSLFVDSINNPPYSGLGGCRAHRCQHYPDRNMVAFCEAQNNDDDCAAKAKNVWFIGTEYDLSSLPKIMIFLTLLIIFFMALLGGLRM